MKYIPKFKQFEIIDNINDILVELNDIGFLIRLNDINFFNYSELIYTRELNINIIIKDQKFPTETFKLSEIEDYIIRLNEYLNSENLEIESMSLSLGNVYDPKGYRDVYISNINDFLNHDIRRIFIKIKYK